jgi:predicted RNA-binding protein YlxR (DUF448 family)
MIRFVVGPDGALVPDPGAELPGRGLWVSAESAAIDRAVKDKGFARAARRAVMVPDDLATSVEALLARRLSDLIGLARRAGAVVAGFEKVRATLKTGAAHLLIAARDGAADGRGKVRMLAPNLAIMTALDANELGAALGRDTVVHAVVTNAAFARRIGTEGRRLAGLRNEDVGEISATMEVV